MHIAFLTPEYPHKLSKGSAGIGSSIRTISIGLVEKEINVSIFIYGQAQDLVFSEEGIKFYFIAHRKFKFFGWLRYRKYLQNYINRYIVTEKIDIVEAPDWTGITAFMKFSCPLVIRMHGSDAYFCHLEKRKQKKKNFLFEKMALKGADKIISVSRFTAEQSAKIFHLDPSIEVIPNMVDAQVLTDQERRLKIKNILYFGSIIRKKGVLDLAQIFNKIIEYQPDVTLKLVGKDVIDFKTKISTVELFYQALSEEAAANIEIVQEVPHQQLFEHIASAAVIAFPSHAEALPMAWLETMAMGKAMVTSDIGWAKEVMIDQRTGYLVDPADHDQYAKKVIKLLNDEQLAAVLGVNAKKRALSHFSKEVVILKNLDFYERVIRQK